MVEPSELLPPLKQALDNSGLDPIIAVQSLDILISFLRDETLNAVHRQQAILCLASSYPHLLKFSAQNFSTPQPWQKFQSIKGYIFNLINNNDVTLGLRLSAIKFAHRCVVIQTRLQSKPNNQLKDTNLSIVPNNNPFINIQQLEIENGTTMHTLLTIIFTPHKLSIVTATINILGILARQRPQYAIAISQALAAWTPAPLQTMVTDSSQLRSVDKLIYGVLKHLVKLGLTGNSTPTVMESLSKQSTRIEAATKEEQARRRAFKRPYEYDQKPNISSMEMKRQRTNDQFSVFHSSTGSTSNVNFDVQSIPIEKVIDVIIESLQNVNDNDLKLAIDKSRESIQQQQSESQQDIGQEISQDQQKSLENNNEIKPTAEPIIEDIKPIDPLKVEIDDDELEFDVEGINRNLNDTVAPSNESRAAINDSRTNTEDSIAVPNVRSKAQSLLRAMQKVSKPSSLGIHDRDQTIKNALNRLCKSIPQKVLSEDPDEEIRTSKLKFKGRNLWSILLVRLITRGLSFTANVEVNKNDDDELNRTENNEIEIISRARNILLDYILADFDRRFHIATMWLNEEWYNYSLNKCDEQKANNILNNYQNLLSCILDYQIPQLSNSYSSTSGTAFVKFIMDLPILKKDTIEKIRLICLDSESARAPIGFLILRELVTLRIPIRDESLSVLLELTIHSDLKTRRAAVNSVRKWVPENTQLTPNVIAFALKALHSLAEDQDDVFVKHKIEDSKSDNNEASTVEDNIENNVKKEQDESEESKVNVKKEPQTESTEPMQVDNQEKSISPEEQAKIDEEIMKSIDIRVLERSELAFSLCLRSPDILNDIFVVYTKLRSEFKETFERSLTPLIRGLGSSHEKLLSVLKTFDQQSEPLALRILNVLTDFGKEKPSVEIVRLVRELTAERNGEIDPRFVIPILQELTKDETISELPRIVKLLNNTKENKQLIRGVFDSVVEPPQSFVSVNTNLPRTKNVNVEKITPAELLTLLHEREIEIGVRKTMEAIGICFSLTDIFRSDVLAIFMQSMSEAKVLPRLFMRTVIQAVTTYKTLVPFVSTNLFSKLITRKIWSNKEMWEGFVRCAKSIAPSSFGALLQLPQDALKDVIKKQPTLKNGLHEYILKKAPKSTQALKLFEEISSSTQNQTPPPNNTTNSRESSVNAS